MLRSARAQCAASFYNLERGNSVFVKYKPNFTTRSREGATQQKNYVLISRTSKINLIMEKLSLLNQWKTPAVRKTKENEVLYGLHAYHNLKKSCVFRYTAHQFIRKKDCSYQGKDLNVSNSPQLFSNIMVN